MADAIRMISEIREVGAFFATTRTHYVDKKVSKDGVFSTYHIWCTGAPSTDFNSAALGSLYTDITNYDLYIMTAAATWTVCGTQS